MKHLSWDLYLKHLENSFPNNLSNIYLIIVKDDFERHKLINLTLSYMPKNNVFSIDRNSAKDMSLNKFINNLSTTNLFNDISIQILDEIDAYKTKEINQLVSFFKTKRIDEYIILAAKEKKSLLSLLSEIDKKGVVLDLFYEKPWEKEKRLFSFIKEKSAQGKKTITKEAMDMLIKYTGLNMSIIETEIEKAIIYIGEKNTLEKEDIKNICFSSKNLTSWELSEKLIYSDQKAAIDFEKDFFVDSSSFQMLLPIFRYNLQEGLKIASAIENNLDIYKLFPKVRPNTLSKKAAYAKQKTSKYFKKGLLFLFEIEKLSKSGCNMPLVLLDLFKAKLTKI